MSGSGTAGDAQRLSVPSVPATPWREGSERKTLGQASNLLRIPMQTLSEHVAAGHLVPENDGRFTLRTLMKFKGRLHRGEFR